MITGFNTDVEHDGVVYHVQTEDKGLKSPLILSLVYVGGTILASKRTPYDDLIASGFDEHELAERLGRQHKLICAAIHTGRIEDLKRQTERDSTARLQVVEEEVFEPEVEAEVEETETFHSALEDPDIIQTGSLADFMPPSIFMNPAVVEPEPIAVEVEEPVSEAPTDHLDYSRVVDYDAAVGVEGNLQIKLMEEKRFLAGEFVKIIIQVVGGLDGQEGMADVPVTLKVLGSSFRPTIFSEKTGADGMATFYAMLPYFTSGRAAILINATTGGHKAELRRVIHQA